MIARKILLLLSCPFLLTTVAPLYAGDFYIAAKVGSMMIDKSGVDDPTNIGIALGYEIGVVAADIGIEGEYTKTSDNGSFAGSDVEVETVGIYLAGRTAGPIYLKGRLGYVDVDVEGPLNVDDSGATYGLGVGVSTGVIQLELEYTQINSDISFLSVSVQF